MKAVVYNRNDDTTYAITVSDKSAFKDCLDGLGGDAWAVCPELGLLVDWDHQREIGYFTHTQRATVKEMHAAQKFLGHPQVVITGFRYVDEDGVDEEARFWEYVEEQDQDALHVLEMEADCAGDPDWDRVRKWVGKLARFIHPHIVLNIIFNMFLRKYTWDSVGRFRNWDGSVVEKVMVYGRGDPLTFWEFEVSEDADSRRNTTVPPPRPTDEVPFTMAKAMYWVHGNTWASKVLRSS